MGHDGSKTRSLGQFLEKTFIYPRRRTFDIIMPPTFEKLRGHIGLGLSIRPSVRLSITRWQLRNSITAYARILKLYV